jgi:hypothetical protein
LESGGELPMGYYNVPTLNEIQHAVEELFSATAIQNSGLLAKALLPEDPALNAMTGSRKVSTLQLLPQKEMQLFCKQLFDISGNTIDPGLKIRIALCIYCHIMESDFMFTCIWNLLRIAQRLEPLWVMQYIEDVLCIYKTELGKSAKGLLIKRKRCGLYLSPKKYCTKT